MSDRVIAGRPAPAHDPGWQLDRIVSELRAAREIRELAATGIPPSKAAPFIACLGSGHARSDECPASVVAYAAGIAELDAAIAELEARREQLARRLASATDTVPPSPDQGSGCTVVEALLSH